VGILKGKEHKKSLIFDAFALKILSAENEST